MCEGIKTGIESHGKSTLLSQHEHTVSKDLREITRQEIHAMDLNVARDTANVLFTG